MNIPVLDRFTFVTLFGYCLGLLIYNPRTFVSGKINLVSIWF